VSEFFSAIGRSGIIYVLQGTHHHTSNENCRISEVPHKIQESSYKDFTFPIFIAVPIERFDYSEYLKIVEDFLTTKTKYRTG